MSVIEPRRSVLDIAGRKIGGEHFALIAGPCAVESLDQTLGTAQAVKAAGAAFLRGGAYKPRTSPHSFQGLGEAGLRILAEAKAQTGMPIVTELVDVRDLEAVLEVADVIQIGARNMQNYALLTEVGRSGCPVMIKRGLSSTIERAADGGRVRPQGGQRARHPLRARDPHVRDGLPLHARPRRRAGAEERSAGCPSSSTRATRPAAATSSSRSRWRRPRRARTASSSRWTRRRTRRSATARRRCPATSSPASRRASSRSPRSSASGSARSSDDGLHALAADRRRPRHAHRARLAADDARQPAGGAAARARDGRRRPARALGRDRDPRRRRRPPARRRRPVQRP